MSEQTSGPNAELIARIRNSARLFAIDLRAIDDSLASKSPGGKARTALDLAFEVTSINNIVANGAKGEPVQLDPPKGWMTAPEGLTREQAIEQFETSINDVCGLLETTTEETLAQPIQTPFGESTFGFMANMLPSHIMYHSGQLNYIQTLFGDDAFHWMG